MPPLRHEALAQAAARSLRFHDPRHTTATLLLKAGVPLATVQRILRHSAPAITSKVYGHLGVEDMRKGLNRLAFGPAVPGPAEALRAAGAEPTPLAASLLQDPGSPQSRRPWNPQLSLRTPGPSVGRGDRI
ncbi:tyrosine-type recombinase/integrase [Pyxidicoccus trucidator]|uniref:tyrosine-type recombinase/integrase n=1 Tax=Pyxidicoccus trucidator TaxID=2709662 RepID=UPI0013DB973A